MRIRLMTPDGDATVLATKTGAAVLLERGYTAEHPLAPAENGDTPLEKLKRPALEERAAAAGVENAAEIANKRELIAAIRDAESE